MSPFRNPTHTILCFLLILSGALVCAQNRGGLIIPGVTSNIDTKGMIEALMEPEKAKVARKEEEVESLKSRTRAWQILRQELSRLQESSKKLYGFQNPFNEKLAQSNDQLVLTATATREADIDEKKIVVKQVAKADRFISGSLARDFEVEPGRFQFQVGDEQVSFAFKGGSLRELAKLIDRKARGVVKASIINDSPQTQVIIIESTKAGAEHRLSFHEQAFAFGVNAGIVEITDQSRLVINLDRTPIVQWEKPLSPDTFALVDGRLTLEPVTGEVKIPVIPPFALKPASVLELQVGITPIDEEPWTPPPLPPGPELSSPGGSEFQGASVRSKVSKLIKPKIEMPKPPQKIDDLQVLFLQSGEEIIKLPALPRGSGTIELKVPVGELAERLDALLLRNNNTHRELSFTGITVYDLTTRSGHKPIRALSEASDAIIFLDGIEVKRGSNTIDDLIPGVTLTLLAESDEPVGVSIKRDIESISSDVIEFVGRYNRLLTYIDILSRSDPTIVEDALHLTEDEKEQATDNVGMLRGDMRLDQLKSRLRTIMISPHKTRTGRELSLMAQVGIATDAAGPGSGPVLDRDKLRGYLDINDEKFEEALSRHPEGVKDLFGYDTDGDFVIDSGVAFSIDRNIAPYTSVGGIIFGKLDTLGKTVARRKSDIDVLNRRLDDYEAKLRKKYGMMEGMLQSLEQNSQAIDNFNRASNR